VSYGTDFLGPNQAGYGPQILPPDVEPVQPFENPVALEAAIPWTEARRQGLTTAISHGLAAGLEISRNLEHQNGQPVEDSTALAWGLLQPLEQHRATSWRDTQPLERGHGIVWQNLLPAEIARRMLWRDTDPRTVVRQARWLLGKLADVPTRAGWRDTAARSLEYNAPWLLGRMVYPDWRIPWGFGRQPRTLVDNPRIDWPPPPEPPPPPVYIPPPGNQVDLPFVCKRFDVPGNQVALPFRKYQCLRGIHVVENNVILKRASDGEEVACLRIEIAGDIDSYANDWSASVALDDFSDLVDPTDTGPVDVIATINGEDHLLLLETYGREDMVDAQRGVTKAVTVQGRSISAELDEPYSARKSRFEDQPKTHWQLMQQELPLAWTLEAHPAWSDYDENLTQNVPADTFSYTDLSPIEAISRIAAATGAVVQQVPASRTLRIVPRYIGKPWTWNTTPGLADGEIDAGQMRSARVSFEPAVKHNGVFVSGETNGALVQCERDGTAGDPWLPAVTDALITHAQHGLQRGLMELAATGRRQIYNCEMAVDANDEGVILAGRLLNVIESETVDWVGQTVAWAVRAGRDRDRGLEVWQSLSIERYLDD